MDFRKTLYTGACAVAMFTATQSAVVLENLIGQFLYGKAEQGGNAAAGEKQ